MQTELEKRIESYISDLGITHDRNNNPDIIHPPSMRLMAKFILEMPELKEVIEALKAYSNAIKDQTVCVSIDYDDLDADDFDIIEEFESGEPDNFGFRARQALDKLRALGLV